MNKVWGFFAVLFALVLASAMAFAFEQEFPENVKVLSDRTDLSFVVSNDSPQDIDFAVELFVPSNYQFTGLPKILRANSSKEIFLTIFSKSNLDGLTYNGKVVFYAGNETVSKNFSISYGEPKAAVVNIGSGQPTDGNVSDLNNSAIAAFAGLLSRPNFEFLLIIVLVIIAAILLIAFIARFVKRISKKQGVGA